MFYRQLPSECKSCANLHCWDVKMNGDNGYCCFKVVGSIKNKEPHCPHQDIIEGSYELHYNMDDKTFEYRKIER